MHSARSKIIIALVLFAMVGQAAASPLLGCAEAETTSASPHHGSDMVHSDSNSPAGIYDHSPTHQHQLADSSAAQHADHNDCTLCVSCNTLASNAQISMGLQLAVVSEPVYPNPHLKNALENPFRPPILS